MHWNSSASLSVLNRFFTITNTSTVYYIHLFIELFVSAYNEMPKYIVLDISRAIYIALDIARAG